MSQSGTPQMQPGSLWSNPQGFMDTMRAQGAARQQQGPSAKGMSQPGMTGGPQLAGGVGYGGGGSPLVQAVQSLQQGNQGAAQGQMRSAVGLPQQGQAPK